MKRTKTGVLMGIFLVMILVVSVFIFAKPDVMPDKANAPFVIPPHAVEVSQGVFYLGTAIDKGRIVEGYLFVHDKRENAKPDGTPGRGKKASGESKCYTFLAKGAKWKTIEPYIVDPTNTRKLKEAFVTRNLASNIVKWETEAGVDILGDEVEEIINRANIGNLNGENEVIFADIDSSGAIAVTIVWGRFGGPPRQRELVEWDMIFDDVEFDWSETGDAGKMDFENIATHELGHSVGMGHPQSTCTEETMYAYASYGEIKKQDLNAGDIAGIRALY